MQNDSTTTNANGSEFSQAGTSSNGSATVGPSESTTSTGADPLAGAGAEEPPTDLGAAAPATTSSAPAPAATSPNSRAQNHAAIQMLKFVCIEEPVRTSNHNLTTWKPPFEAPAGSQTILKEIIQRADDVRAPSQAIPVPTGSARYGSTFELFNRLQDAITKQALVPEETSALLTFWTLSTWFADGLSIAPGLSIVAPEFEGDLVLRALRHFSHYPMMLTRADISSLQKLNWHTPCTALFYDPHISKQMVTTLGSASARGYLINVGGMYKDFYGPKAIYLGAEVSADRIPRRSVQVRLQPMPAGTQRSAPLSEAAVQDLQNQLQRYRLKNLVKVYNSDFDASTLTSDTRAIANALGACVVDSPDLQSKLVSLLGPVESQRQADRSTSLEAVTLEAMLNLAHAGKVQILVGEVANEVNRLMEARGERLRYGAENTGHCLKKVGLSTRRLGKAGRGLVMHLATMTRAHELAGVYGGAGLEQDENNLHCPLCIEKSDLCR